MLERAAAFNELVLGSKQSMLSSERTEMEEGEYRIEYAVRIPQEKRQEFEQWMGSAKPAQLTIGRAYYNSHESATRLVQDNGREVEELYEKFAIALP
jgi:hypothetical protein